MLIRICLIVALVAGLAVGALDFTKVKEKITTLQTDLKTETGLKDKANADLASTRTELKKTGDKLKQTETTLAATTEERDSAVAERDKQKKLADQLSTDLKKTTQERDDAQAEVASYKATGMNPAQIVASRNRIKDLEDNLVGTQSENKLLGQKLAKVQNELNRYIIKEYVVQLPATLKGKVTAADPKWNFVVLNIGEDQGVQDYGELLVNRNGKLVAKIIVRTVKKNESIANVMPGWQLGEILEGDQVIPAHPAS
jgi:myosin heavy subunit